MGIKICGAGCSLIDYLYTGIDFDGPTFRKYASRSPGDGGLTPGKLVFAEEFETFSGVAFSDALGEITGGKAPDTLNLGGPSIVALIHAGQLLEDRDVSIDFHGVMGDDETGRRIIEFVSTTPVGMTNYRTIPGVSPTTIVLSDPGHHGGKGERAFINDIAAAGRIFPDDLGDDFFDTDVVVFGGTGLVPGLHDGLTALCERSKASGCLTIVNTVFDFRAEKKDPVGRWPLGESDRTYELIDLLMVDQEEGLRMSGEATPGDALRWFLDRGVGAAIVTCGAKDYHIAAAGGWFSRMDPAIYPVANQVEQDVEDGLVVRGDTTGCGDNFVGGVLASIAGQLLERGGGVAEGIDLLNAASWGSASGGYACLYVGGTYVEAQPGEKRDKVSRYYRSYREQIGLGPA